MCSNKNIEKPTASGKDKLESTTSYFSDEEEAVREFAYGKIMNHQNINEGEYENSEGQQEYAYDEHIRNNNVSDRNMM